MHRNNDHQLQVFDCYSFISEENNNRKATRIIKSLTQRIMRNYKVDFSNRKTIFKNTVITHNVSEIIKTTLCFAIM